MLEQYDAISTNGSAAMPAFVALCSLELIAENAERIRSVGQRIHDGFKSLAAEFPACWLARRAGHLDGLKFRSVEQAKAFHRKLLEAGLWTRVHAYHEGHSTLLTKLGLLADDSVVEYVFNCFREGLKREGNSGDNR